MTRQIVAHQDNNRSYKIKKAWPTLGLAVQWEDLPSTFALALCAVRSALTPGV